MCLNVIDDMFCISKTGPWELGRLWSLRDGRLLEETVLLCSYKHVSHVSHAPVHICGVVWCCWMVFDVVLQSFLGQVMNPMFTPARNFWGFTSGSWVSLGLRPSGRSGSTVVPLSSGSTTRICCLSCPSPGSGTQHGWAKFQGQGQVTKEASTWEMHEIYSICQYYSMTVIPVSYMVDHIGRIVRVKHHRIMSSPCNAFKNS